MEIRIPILNNEYKVIVVFGPQKKVRKTLKKYQFPDTSVSFDGCRGLCISAKGCFPVIAMPKAPNTSEEIGTLAHEASHSIDFIMKSIGEGHANKEVYAHCVGAVVRIALEKADKIKKKKKKKKKNTKNKKAKSKKPNATR